MLSGFLDDFHDVMVILISITNQILNIIITYLLYIHGWDTYYTVSLIFVILNICSNSIIFTARFVPCTSIRKKLDCIQPICHTLLYILIGICLAPITSIIIYIIEVYLHGNAVKNIANGNKNKCIRIYGCVYIQYHESYLNQWMHFKFAKYLGFMCQLITDTVPHLFIQIILLMTQTSNVSDDGLLIYLEMSIFISILSFMTKTFIFGYGFDNKIYIFSWMCYTTDLLNIFFIILFVFYTENAVVLTWLNIATANNVFAKIFMFFLSYSIIPLVAIFAICGSAYFLLMIIGDQYWEWFYYICCPCLLIPYGCMVPFVSIAVLIAMLFINASIVAYFVSEKQHRFKYITRLEVNQMVNYMIEFLNKKSSATEKELYSYPNNDKVIRILAVNRAYHGIRFASMGMAYCDDKLFKFIANIIDTHSWDKVNEEDIVSACVKVGHRKKKQIKLFKIRFLNEYVGFVRYSYSWIFSQFAGFINENQRYANRRYANHNLENCVVLFFCTVPLIIYLIVLTSIHLLLFMYFCSRILIIFYPIIILIDSIAINEDEPYLALQWLVLILFTSFYIGICVLLFGHIIPVLDALDFIRPSDHSVNLTLKNNTLEEFVRRINVCYGVVQLSKYIQAVLIQKFGDDVATIIIEYAFEEWMVKNTM